MQNSCLSLVKSGGGGGWGEWHLALDSVQKNEEKIRE